VRSHDRCNNNPADLSHLMTDFDLLKELAETYQLGDLDRILERDDTKFDHEHLVALDLSNLALTEVPETLQRFTHLQHLDLSHNAIDHLPGFLGGMGHLTTFKFKGNPMPEPDNLLSYLNSEEVSEVMKQVLPKDQQEKARARKQSHDKPCTWCGSTSGYRVEQANEETESEFGTVYMTLVICRNCKYVHHFYGDTSYIFD